jgi:addiction module HigA family antidote
MTILREDLDAGRIDLSSAIDLKAGDPNAGTIGPIYPGEILREEFLGPMGIAVYRLAMDIGVPPNRITAILANDRSITADTSLRLGRYFGMSESFWLNLQTGYDLRVTKRELGDRLEHEVKPRAA